MNTAAVMQPYIFPYLGYFQLYAAAEVFVFYDNVNFIKQGWINRNRILSQGKETLLTFPCKRISSFARINEVELLPSEKVYNKLLKSIEQSYARAPEFENVFPLIERIFDNRGTNISTFAINSVIAIAEYLGVETEFKISSIDFADLSSDDRADRLIEICKSLECSRYINSIGGKELYDKNYFQQSGITLNFLKPQLPPYPQLNRQDFAAGLSIIDVMMNCTAAEVIQMMESYELE